MSEEAACKRIRAARAAREFPALFPALAEGRLHLGGVVLLAPYVSEETAGELLAVATHKSKAQIERLLAERFPRRDVAIRVRAMTETPGTDRLAVRPFEPQPLPLGPSAPSAPSSCATSDLRRPRGGRRRGSARWPDRQRPSSLRSLKETRSGT